MIVKIDVSFTIPMNMLPMFGIAIFVACGRVIRRKTLSGCMPEREPGLALAPRDRL